MYLYTEKWHKIYYVLRKQTNKKKLKWNINFGLCHAYYLLCSKYVNIYTFIYLSWVEHFSTPKAILCSKYIYIYIYIYINERSEYFIDKKSRVKSSYITKHKTLQNHSHMIWAYIVINTNKILTIKCYLWLSSSTNPCTIIVKENICSEQTRSRTMAAKYPKNLFKPAIRDNPSHLTNLHPIDRSWGQI